MAASAVPPGFGDKRLGWSVPFGQDACPVFAGEKTAQPKSPHWRKASVPLPSERHRTVSYSYKDIWVSPPRSGCPVASDSDCPCRMRK